MTSAKHSHVFQNLDLDKVTTMDNYCCEKFMLRHSSEFSYKLSEYVRSFDPKHLENCLSNSLLGYIQELKSFALSMYKFDYKLTSLFYEDRTTQLRKDLGAILRMDSFLITSSEYQSMKRYSAKALYFQACAVFDIFPCKDSLYDRYGDRFDISCDEQYLAERGVTRFASKNMANFIITIKSNKASSYPTLVSDPSFSFGEISNLCQYVESFELTMM